MSKNQSFFRSPILASMALLIAVAFMATGCAKSDKELLRLNQEQAATISAMTDEVNRLNQELDALYGAREELLRAKTDLEGKLQGEMAAGNLSVSMQDRGLVVTVLDRVLFDSGKSDLKESSRSTLEKVGDTLVEQVRDNLVYVEGHTDNDPIRHSGWRSNWELSTARATEVIHFFVDQQGVEPRRLIASGYGEFYPVMSNETSSGKQKNRRVEIVISPQKFTPTAVAGTA
ncbi:MAG: OmpA family protein [Candidatus Omnitrophota bacterium]|nr:OmpA family protein [Candidatus Omnitrophota bacterium]